MWYPLLMTTEYPADEPPEALGETLDGEYVWRRDDEARVVRYADGSTRPYDEAENTAADARQTRASQKEILADLQGYADRVQAIIDTPNATINANPAAYIKDLARAVKRTLGSVRDLTRLA